MFGGASNSSSPGSKSDNDSKSDGKFSSPDSSPDSAGPSPANPDLVASADKRGGIDGPPARHDSGDKKRRSSGVGSKASSLLASAKNSLNFSHIARSNSDLSAQTSLQKLGKHDAALAVPQGQHNNSAGESVPGLGSTFRVGVWEDRNKKCRRTMEDTHAFLYNFLENRVPAVAADDDDEGSVEKHFSEKEKISSTHEEVEETDNGYFAIFDGHAGTFAADWCGKKLHLILEDLIRKNPNGSVPELLDQTFTSVDAQLEKLPLKNSGCTAAIAVLRWEDRGPSDRSANKPAKVVEAPQSEKDKDGTVETVRALPSEPPAIRIKASGRQRLLYTANVGDARIVLCRNGKALRLSYDHKGSDENEGKRIANAGGLILNNRVNGVLAVTRALGDAYIKDLVTGHPYTTETVIQPEIDEFIIIACDGLWDVCSDQEAVDLVRDIHNPATASKLLVDHALNRFSTDNLSCMIIRLDREGHIHSQRGHSTDNGAARVSEVDKLVGETEYTIAQGHAEMAQEGDFVPTILNGKVEEEPAVMEESDGSEPVPGDEREQQDPRPTKL